MQQFVCALRSSLTFEVSCCRLLRKIISKVAKQPSWKQKKKTKKTTTKHNMPQPKTKRDKHVLAYMLLIVCINVVFWWFRVPKQLKEQKKIILQQIKTLLMKKTPKPQETLALFVMNGKLLINLLLHSHMQREKKRSISVQ
jgi:hypothetical protein